MIILLIWIAVLIAVVVIYLRQIYCKFSRYGVKYVTPIPLIGNLGKVLLRRDHFVTDMINLYSMFPEEKFVGRFEFISELVMIRDLDLIKQLTIKDFEHFLDHRSVFSESNSFFARNLLSLKGQEWKDMRSTLSPVFTSSKIRGMVPFMVEASDHMIAILRQNIKNSNEGYIEVDCKDLTARYANDVIASCVFGLKVNSHVDVDNQFFIRGRETSSFDFYKVIKLLVLTNIPKLGRLLKLDFISPKSKQFFKDLVLGTMNDREANQIIRPDMIHLLMEVKKGRLTHENVKSDDIAAGFATVEESSVGRKQVNRVWSDDDLTAQAALFFIAGFETISTAMCFLLYELAINPEIQDRLAKEIKDQDRKNGGKFDFTTVQNMTYLDMVTSEVLRLWPPAVALDRNCTKEYNLGKPNKNAEKDFIVHEGTTVVFPTFAIHRDANYYPDPDKFDPERFSSENKHKIHPFAYMPFGIGPRNCIGSRFALCEMKAMTYQILLQMEVSPSESTCIPAKLAKDSFSLRLHGGHNLRFRVRA